MLLSACNSDKSAEVTNNKLKVATTIKPIQSILLAIAGDLVDSDQLIPDGASPHDYSFKPSDMRKIKNADIIFRIDENMEAFLQPALKLKKEKALLVSLADEQGIKLLTIASHDNKKHSEEQHDHGNIDLHIWTSPKNAIAMANTIATSLIKNDPQNTKKYEANLASFTDSLQLASDEIAKELSSLRDKPYIVLHNSWQYFADYYGMQKPQIVNLQHSVSSSAKSITKIRKQIVSNNVRCVFSEPGNRESQVKTLIENLDIKTTEIDVLQSKLPTNESSYVDWLKTMGMDIKTCLE